MIEVYEYGTWDKRWNQFVQQMSEYHDEFKYYSGHLDNRIAFVIYEDGRPVAIGEILKESMFRKGVAGLSYVSVAPDYKGRGYAKQLLQYIFDWVAEQGRWTTLSMSEYSVLGFYLLKPFIDELKKNFKLKFECNNEERPGYPFVDEQDNHHWPTSKQELLELMTK